MYKGTFYIYHVSNFRNFGVASKRGRMMEDLISRQTIIDGLEFVIEHGIETYGAHSISAEKMLEFVRELPTVQPEIVRCKDCKHYGCVLYSATQFEYGECFGHEESHYTFEVKPDDFCSRAERRTE